MRISNYYCSSKMQANLRNFSNLMAFGHRSFSHTKNELLKELQNVSAVSSKEILDVIKATDRKYYSE
jgi:hypothetical protein